MTRHWRYPDEPRPSLAINSSHVPLNRSPYGKQVLEVSWTRQWSLCTHTQCCTRPASRPGL